MAQSCIESLSHSGIESETGDQIAFIFNQLIRLPLPNS